jgi:hypothetical protein
MHEAVLDRDEYLVVLREMIKFHIHFKQVPEATDAYCRAAMYLYNRRDRAISWDGRGVRL